MADRDDRKQLQLGLQERIDRIQRAAAEKPRKKQTDSFSVSEIVRIVARSLESLFDALWVEGEVSNLKTPVSGHLYFTLKDARSQLSVVMFRSAAQRLNFRVKDGQKLRCLGRLAVYEAQGRFQLTAESAEPAGVGALQLAFERLKARLSAEGLFDEGHKKPLPLLPRSIAIVTSKTGAALRDVIRVLDGRYPTHLIVCPTTVQGKEAAMEIVSALRRADRLRADLIIVGRGGGSIEDLWAFNTEPVARAIFKAKTPVISAVGHEVDLTISDLVADRRAPTPSAAAEIAVPEMRELTKRVFDLRRRLHRAQLQNLRHQALRLERLRGTVVASRRLLDRGRLRLDELHQQARAAIGLRLGRARQELDGARLGLRDHQPRARLARRRADLQKIIERLTTQIEYAVERKRAQLGEFAALLDAMSPLSVLARGYSVVFDERGRVIRRASDVALGDRLRLRLERGELGCRVDAVEPDPGNREQDEE